MAAAPARCLYDEGVTARIAANNEVFNALGLSNHPANTKKAPKNLAIGLAPALAFGHPATICHKTIVLCTLAMARRGGLTRSLAE
jgi:hypothetical protein